MGEQPRMILAIENIGKAIPYPAAQHGTSTNHGFKQLKGSEDPAASVPEAKDNAAIMRAINLLNANETHFFTIGCEKALNKNPDGSFFMKGFLEFSYNYREAIADPQAYFRLFLEFDELLRMQTPPYLRGHFYWVMEQNRFLDVSRSGYSLVTWLTTEDRPSGEEASSWWERALNLQTDYLLGFQLPEAGGLQRIY
jgi:hypothetical protein